jgi:hypothetical protein
MHLIRRPVQGVSSAICRCSSQFFHILYQFLFVNPTSRVCCFISRWNRIAKSTHEERRAREDQPHHGFARCCLLLLVPFCAPRHHTFHVSGSNGCCHPTQNYGWCHPTQNYGWYHSQNALSLLFCFHKKRSGHTLLSGAEFIDTHKRARDRWHHLAQRQQAFSHHLFIFFSWFVKVPSFTHSCHYIPLQLVKEVPREKNSRDRHRYASCSMSLQKIKKNQPST